MPQDRVRRKRFGRRVGAIVALYITLVSGRHDLQLGTLSPVGRRRALWAELAAGLRHSILALAAVAEDARDHPLERAAFHVAEDDQDDEDDEDDDGGGDEYGAAPALQSHRTAINAAAISILDAVRRSPTALTVTIAVTITHPASAAFALAGERLQNRDVLTLLVHADLSKTAHCPRLHQDRIPDILTEVEVGAAAGDL